MVTGSLTLLKMAIGKSLGAELPTRYVRAPQFDILESEGCMRSWVSAFRKPVGLERY